MKWYARTCISMFIEVGVADAILIIFCDLLFYSSDVSDVS